MHLLYLLWLGLIHSLSRVVFASPVAGYPRVEEMTVTINDKAVTLGDQISSQEWHCTYTIGSDPTVLDGTVKFYDVPDEPRWTSQASAAFDDYLYVDHSAPWLLLNHIPGNTTVHSTSPTGSQCRQIYTSAQQAALTLGLELYQKTGFFLSSPDLTDYVFTDNFTSCRAVDFEGVAELEGWRPDQATKYITKTVNRIFDPNRNCGHAGLLGWFENLMHRIMTMWAFPGDSFLWWRFD